MEPQIDCVGKCLPNRGHANGLVYSIGVAGPYCDYVSRTVRADASCEEEFMGGLSPIQLDTASQGGIDVAEHHTVCLASDHRVSLTRVERLHRAARRIRARYPIL